MSLSKILTVDDIVSCLLGEDTLRQVRALVGLSLHVPVVVFDPNHRTLDDALSADMTNHCLQITTEGNDD